MNTTRTDNLTIDRSAPAVAIRPLQAGDAEALRSFIDGLGAASRRLRFHGAIKGCSDALLARLMGADGQRQVALVAVQVLDDGERIVGDARYFVGPAGRAEFAIMVADAQQGRGVARQLMAALIERARGAGLRAMDGEVMQANPRMQAFVQRLGFERDLGADCDADVQRWTLALAVSDVEAAAEAVAPVQAALDFPIELSIDLRPHPLRALRGWWRAAFQGVRA